MKKYYIPTTSLNFNNILASESISPKSFYLTRSFGYQRWDNIPENPFNNSIVLYDELRSFNRPSSDIEDHPLLIEIALDESVENSLVMMDEHLFLSNHTIYIDPFSSRLIFFSEEDKKIALSLSGHSIETKFVRLYQKKIEVINPPAESYPNTEYSREMQNLNSAEIEKDKRINKMKGLLYGYYVGALLSAEKEDVVKLNIAREIRNILAAILASIDHRATMQQKERLKYLYSYQSPFLTELRELISDKSQFDAIVSLVRNEYGFIHGEINVDERISTLLASSANRDNNPVVEEINSLIKQIERDIENKSKPLPIENDQIVVMDRNLREIRTLERADQILYKAWINDVLSKDEYSGKISTFKNELSDDVTIKAKEVCEGEWRGSYPERTLNALRKHIRGDEFPHKWGNDIFSSLAALIISGDDWQKQLQFMQGKEMTDYRIAFSMYGTINGFANLPRDFTDVLFNRDSKYIADVYQEFYGQLFGRGVIKLKKERYTEKDTKPQPVYENTPEETCSSTTTQDKTSCKVTNIKDDDIELILKDIRYGKRKQSLGKKIILPIIKIYNDCGKHASDSFYNNIRKIHGLGEEAFKAIKNTIGIETTDDGLFSQNRAEQTDTMTNDTAVSFVSDKTLPDIVKQMNIQDGCIVKILIDDIEYIQKHHKNDYPVNNANCIEHLNNLIYSNKKKGTPLQRTPENEKITNELINRLKQRFINND